MNPSTALARVLVDELIRGGVREAVLSPGSRNAPLSFALHDADAAGRLRLHVRIDERTAGFLALGLAKASGRPVPVVTTSGTAVANLHPAVLEASHAGVPLVVLTADRPAELRGSGANQTVDQVKMYGGAVRLFHDVAAPEDRGGQNAYWRSLAGRAFGAARGDLGGDPGPVHLNVAFREPLVPDRSPDWPEPLAGRPDGELWVVLSRGLPPPSVPYAGESRTLVLVGDCSAELALAARVLAQQRGWPLVAEPLSEARASSLQAGALLLSTPSFLATHRPVRVLVVGRPTLSRSVGALLRDPAVAVDVVSSSTGWADPAGVAEIVAPAALFTGPPLDRSGASWTMSSGPEPAHGDPEFLRAWGDADRRAGAALAAFLDGESALTGLHVARTLLEAVPEGSGRPLLVLGSSSPVRDVDLAAVWAMPLLQVVANRGAAGIDGTVSTAVGAALGVQRDPVGGVPAYALMGDLTFLHDSNGLVLGPDEPRPDLCIVVVNDGGGSVFGLLEQGAPEHAGAFERVFGTPHGVDLSALCAATGAPHERVVTVEELRKALGRPTHGIRVVEAQVDRRGVRELHARLRAAVAEALR